MSNKGIGSIKDYTPNFNFIIPKFDIATWHDYMESNFRSIDALFYNLFDIQNFSGEWTQLTKYNIGQVLFIGKDLTEDGTNSEYAGRMVTVLVDHTTDNSEYFNIYYKQHPDYYELFADASTAQKFAQQAQQSAANALQSEQKAKQSETNAKNSENIAIQKANEASISASNAKISETNAKNYETSALNSKNAAKESQDAAKVSENNAAQSVITQTNNFNTYNNELIATKNESLIKIDDAVSDGLSAISGISDALNYNNITNCITAIPQDIKLELNADTLTLKAGSKMYDAKQNSITLNSDVSYNMVYNSKVPCYGFVRKGTNEIYIISLGDPNLTFSENTVMYNSEELWLPFGLVTRDVAGKSTIDQIFNGFGYIGSYRYGINVEGKAANGNNPDGSINNLTYKIDGVNGMLDIDRGVHKYILLHKNALISAYSWYEQEERPNFVENRDQYWYNPKTRETFYYRSATNNGIRPAVLVGEYDIDTNGKIYNFKTKSTFQAADYQDVPKLATDNTFTGVNTFERGAVFIKNVNIDRDVNPSAIQYSSWLIQDKNGKQICNFYVSQNTAGTVTASMIATGRDGVDARISVSRDVNKTTMSYAPTPPTSDNSTQIATTNWVRSVCPTLTGGNSFTGVNTVPTQSVSDNSTRIATTAFVNNFFNTAGKVTGKCVPNYKAGVSFSGTFTTSFDGLLVMSCGNNNPYGEEINITVNGQQFYVRTYNLEERQTLIVPVAKGTVVTVSQAGNISNIIYPYIGA